MPSISLGGHDSVHTRTGDRIPRDPSLVPRKPKLKTVAVTPEVTPGLQERPAANTSAAMVATLTDTHVAYHQTEPPQRPRITLFHWGLPSDPLSLCLLYFV